MSNKTATVTILAADFSEIDSYVCESIKAAKAAIVEHVQNALTARFDTTATFSDTGEAAIYDSNNKRIRTICYARN